MNHDIYHLTRQKENYNLICILFSNIFLHKLNELYDNTYFQVFFTPLPEAIYIRKRTTHLYFSSSEGQFKASSSHFTPMMNKTKKKAIVFFYSIEHLSKNNLYLDLFKSI
jgi:hypothetical protein